MVSHYAQAARSRMLIENPKLIEQAREKRMHEQQEILGITPYPSAPSPLTAHNYSVGYQCSATSNPIRS